MLKKTDQVNIEYLILRHVRGCSFCVKPPNMVIFSLGGENTSSCNFVLYKVEGPLQAWRTFTGRWKVNILKYVFTLGGRKGMAIAQEVWYHDSILSSDMGGFYLQQRETRKNSFVLSSLKDPTASAFMQICKYILAFKTYTRFYEHSISKGCLLRFH